MAEETYQGEVCRKIDLLRKDLKELENKSDLNNREIWQTIDKIKEDLYECKIRFASFDSKTCGDLLGVQKDFINTNKDLDNVRSDINFLRSEQKDFWTKYENDQKKQNEKFQEIVDQGKRDTNEKFDIINNTISNIKMSTIKNSATIATVMGLIILIGQKVIMG